MGKAKKKLKNLKDKKSNQRLARLEKVSLDNFLDVPGPD
jgi:hypothetical protein